MFVVTVFHCSARLVESKKNESGVTGGAKLQVTNNKGFFVRVFSG